MIIIIVIIIIIISTNTFTSRDASSNTSGSTVSVVVPYQYYVYRQDNMSTSGCITDLKPSQPTSQESMQPRRLPVTIQPTSKPSRQSTR